MKPSFAALSIVDRMVAAVEMVRERLLRAAKALEAAGIPYAVVGGNAVAAWVTTLDAAAVRATQDVGILLRRADLDAAAAALETAGFVRRHVAGIEMFLDGPDAKARDAVHILFAGERVKQNDIEPSPDVAVSENLAHFRVISLEALVRMKLTSYRYKDRTHLLDMLDVGLIDASWRARYAPELASRLQHLIESPEA